MNRRQRLAITLFPSLYPIALMSWTLRRTRHGSPLPAMEQISAVLGVGRKAVRQMDAQGLLQADARFHQMIYWWSGNQVIESSMQINWHHIRRGMAQVLRDPAAAAPSWDAHQRIAEAMLANEANVAESEMMLHIELARTKTMAAFEDASHTAMFEQQAFAREISIINPFRQPAHLKTSFHAYFFAYNVA